MGVREIRYCDLTGKEDGVETHVVHIDQMRVEIDLAEPEYAKLLKLLGPYIDAGRVEASVPDAPSRRAVRSTSTALTVEQRQQVREWAEERGIEVPSNNRFKGSIVAQWREETGTPAPAQA